MAYQTGAAVDLEDLLGDLDTFIVANGWTQDQLDNTNNQAAWSKGSVYVSAAWSTATLGQMSLHQALGYVGGNRPGKHTDDSGNGFNTTASPTEANIITERCVYDIGDGPFPSYHFFENDSSPAYVHVVVESSSGIFRHFGFGELNKTGDWTGGEYCYGHYFANSTGVSGSSTGLLDGLFREAVTNNRRRAATIHMEGLPGMAGTSKWGQISGFAAAANMPDDDGGNAKAVVMGGFRSGPIAVGVGYPMAGATSGLINSYPIGLFYLNPSTNFTYFLGYMPDVRGVGISGIAAGDEITISSDTWVFFPTCQKTTANNTTRTYNSGIMYKKVTT